jgi:flagellar motor switch protein FliN/FliY
MAETQQTQEAQTTATTPEVQSAEFEQVQDIPAKAAEDNLDILLDINMPITVTLGKTEIPFKRLLQLGPGSVLELNKAVGEPAELFVQDIKFATGDIVVVNDAFAIRIREILGADQVEAPTV